KEHSARNFVFPGSAAFSAAEKRDYEPCFAVRQQLFTPSLRLRGSTSGSAARYRLLRSTNLASLLPRRVSVSAKEA
ncbi:hypothetical protein, partial [Burkholderia contaminans]|uniref:hypothetical protein n=1 Tax=Burkholderia contaminans TaxID=488447 RepID=UPI001CF215DD